MVYEEDREKFEKECWENPKKITDICNNNQDSSNSIVGKWKTFSPEKQLTILALTAVGGVALGRLL